MPALVDLERIQKIFARRGERVVLIMPDSEPVVLVPLNEYEQFSQARLPLAVNANQAKNTKNPIKASQPSAKASALEVVDPLQGGLEDDDQYYPEPL